MTAGPPRLTDDERRELVHIPDNVETRDVLERLLFNLSLKNIFTNDNIRQIVGK
jgi:hypothetical protein